MQVVYVTHPTHLGAWRDQARSLLARNVPPHKVMWRDDEGDGDLFAAIPAPLAPPAEGPALRVPRAFVDLAQSVIRHSSPGRFALLYRLLWRVSRGERHVLQDRADADMAQAAVLVTQVRRDIHHMHAFVRFSEITDETGPILVAWYRPDHHVVEAVAPHFRDRLGANRWSILTPVRSVHWDGGQLHFGPGGDEPPRSDADCDAVAACWNAYYAATFNPARLNVAAMASHMPRKHWRHMGETAQIPDLVRRAGGQVRAMLDAPLLEPRQPSPRSHRSRS